MPSMRPIPKWPTGVCVGANDQVSHFVIESAQSKRTQPQKHKNTPEHHLPTRQRSTITATAKTDNAHHNNTHNQPTVISQHTPIGDIHCNCTQKHNSHQPQTSTIADIHNQSGHRQRAAQTHAQHEQHAQRTTNRPTAPPRRFILVVSHSREQSNHRSSHNPNQEPSITTVVRARSSRSAQWIELHSFRCRCWP